MHSSESGVTDHLARDDAHAIEIARACIADLGNGGWVANPCMRLASQGARGALYSARDLHGIVGTDVRQGFDMRDVIARIVDGSSFREFKKEYGPTILTLTVIVGGSFGAGNYGMCGRAYSPRFLWMWPVSAGSSPKNSLLNLVSEREGICDGIRSTIRGDGHCIKGPAQHASLKAEIEDQSTSLYATSDYGMMVSFALKTLEILYPGALRADNLSISSDGLRLGLFTQCILALIAVPGLPGQTRFTLSGKYVVRWRYISTLSRVIEALRQWESLSPYQAIVDEGKIATCLEVELRALGECDIHHVLGFEREWAKNYIRAKELDDRDLEEKLLRIAEESPEPAIENPEPMGVQSSVPSTSTAMGDWLGTGRPTSASIKCPPTLPIVAPLMDELLSIRDKPLGEQTDSPMLQVTHVPFVTISDINKMEDAHYLRNIRDLSLQIRLYSGHSMRGNGSIMTYLANILEDKFVPDTDFEEQPPIKKNMGQPWLQFDSANLVGRPNTIKLLQRVAITSRGLHLVAVDTQEYIPFLGLCRYVKEQRTQILGLVSPWEERTLSDYVKVFQIPTIFLWWLGLPKVFTITFKRATSRGLHAGAVLLARKEHLESEGKAHYDAWHPSFNHFTNFTHKTPFEGVPMPHGLVAFLVQGPIPNHPSTTLTEVMSTITPRRCAKSAAIAAAEVLPSEEEGQRAVERGLSDKMWSLLQSCWKYEPRARPTMNKILQSLNEIAPTSAIGVKNITAQVRKTTIFPVATGGQCDFVTFPHEKVAMKRLRVFHDRELEPVRKELMREVRLWSELSHPNYPDANRRDIVSDALKGLCYLHELGILHGDLKGANILIKEDCTACLSDLGLARASHEATITSMRGNGSIRYMSPEILLTNDESGTLRIPIKTMESDIFAFGLVIRELLGNEIPYSEIQSIPHIIRLIASGSRPSRPKNLIASEWLCDKMWEIVEAALAGNPELRPTACELSQHLSRIPMATRHAPRRRVSEPNPPRPKLRESGYMRWALSEL
ncbi:hypothetical protein RHS01_04465 [Rhizoctonia solani]|uniref:Protein kinase domain-containing protein n=1 Tax=Rhizoctonia solani TaxID=456999 RepID=A0A8H7IGV6_9AGAM|nr:hypothetical protein RHS01_04465 [Rhizoctonia solani]